MISLVADCRNATATSDEVLTTGSVGIEVEVTLSDDFDGLTSVIVFRNGDEAADVTYSGKSVTVPPQCLTVAGRQLIMGVYATDTDDTVVIPTVWAGAGMVVAGTEPSTFDPAEAAPSWAAQVQSAAQEALEAAQSVVDAAEAGEYDGYSPSAAVTQGDGFATISVTDADGTTTATLYDGAVGATGQTGAAAGFGDVTATVDGTSGTPSVTVTTSGEDTAKSFAFAFSGLKGATGATGGTTFGGTMSGTVASTSTAYASAPIEVDVNGLSLQDGTPTPSNPVSIESVSSLSMVYVAGKNLADLSSVTWTAYRNFGTLSACDGSVRGTTSSSYKVTDQYVPVWHLVGTTIAVSPYTSNANYASICFYSSQSEAGYISCARATATVPEGARYMLLCTTGDPSSMQVELGTVVTAYTAYDGTSTAIDLDGHELRSLPDGTHDTIEISNGSARITQRVGITTAATTDGVTGTIGVDVMSSTGQIADGATVLYALDSEAVCLIGDIELPALPGGDATVWAYGNVGPLSMTMEYDRDLRLVVEELESAIAAI